MEAFEAILTRRSIRKYTAEPISEEIINELLKAGLNAPSAGNQQPWHMVVIRDRELLNKIPDIHPHSKMLNEAQAALLVCGDQSLELHKGYWVLDCSAATENILLAAHAKGLGAVWLGIYPREERVTGVRKLLSIPESITPFSLISLGYPAEIKHPANRFDSSKIHFDKW